MDRASAISHRCLPTEEGRLRVEELGEQLGVPSSRADGVGNGGVVAVEHPRDGRDVRRRRIGRRAGGVARECADVRLPHAVTELEVCE